MRRLQALGADLGAVHDGAAAKKAVGIVQLVEPLLPDVIPAVDDEPIGLYQAGRSHELVVQR
jgi:hypothetical protein